MNEDKLLKILKSFRDIRPEAEFRARSRSLILEAHQHPRKLAGIRLGFFESLKLGAALTLASILTLIVFGSVSYLKFTNVSPAVLTSFDPSVLKTESTSFDFRIQLGEARYFDEATRDISAILDEISKEEEARRSL